MSLKSVSPIIGNGHLYVSGFMVNFRWEMTVCTTGQRWASEEAGVILQLHPSQKACQSHIWSRNNPIVGLLILNSIGVSKLWPFPMVRGCTAFCIQGLPGLRDKQVLSWSAPPGLPADHKMVWQWLRGTGSAPYPWSEVHQPHHTSVSSSTKRG